MKIGQYKYLKVRYCTSTTGCLPANVMKGSFEQFSSVCLIQKVAL